MHDNTFTMIENIAHLIYITKIVSLCVDPHGYLRNPLTYDREILQV